MLLMQTDLPLPVAPAISRCGIFARSPTTASPLTSAPERQPQLRAALRPRVGLEQLAEADGLAGAVRHLDARPPAARHRRFEPQRRAPEPQREVVLSGPGSC